jgi:cytochrome P450
MPEDDCVLPVASEKRGIVTEINTSTYNPFEPGFAEDPYPQYDMLRDNDPVHQSPFGIWVLFEYDDVLRFLRDSELSVDERLANPGPLTELAHEVLGNEADLGSYAMLNRDPPDHTRLRRLVSKAFTPRMIEGLTPRIQQLVDEKLDSIADRGNAELISDLAFPLPFQVITELLGMPETDTEQLREWSGLLVRTLEPVYDADVLRAIGEAGRSMTALVNEAIAWKRRNSSSDLLSGLIAAEEHGDVLSEDELADQVILLYIAGHETTVNLIGNGTLALVRNREQLDQLRSDPDLMVNGVEELLRYDSPVQMSRRITLREVEIGDKTIESGAFVVLVLASANRDRRHFGEFADQLDIVRSDAKTHLSFGGGHHLCLGAALARLEAQIAIGSLIRRFPRLTLAEEPQWNGRINLRGLSALPIELSD